MRDFVQSSRDAARDIEPRWNDGELEDRLGELNARIQRRVTVRAIASVFVVTTIVAAAAVTIWFATSDSRPRADGPRAATPLHVGDRAVVTPLTPDTVVTAVAVGPRETSVRLDRGVAHFVVRPDPSRSFRVDAGIVEIDVVGTEFTVARQQDRVEVTVTHGAVRARWSDGERTVSAGESVLLPSKLGEDGEHAVATPSPLAPSPTTEDEPSVAVQPMADEPEPAMTPHSSPARAATSESFDALLEQADQSRLSDRPGDAIPLLERALAIAPDRKREAIAAFTLGRVFLDLDAPAKAAPAFHRARTTDPTGPLSEDALAREVQAWSRAGEPVLARERADEYFERYPSGRRTRLVKEYGGTR